ncbi:hypothetical protein KC19_7G132400 [Ceratodon purpureus]|uniref:Uncharacterized protein n=1 Tax=Ceratodon purpureus TaxID=3225 RepID=A0A8T0H824_CERPU|nr:hypothetical protein KC19_7G132400 [Ceratodon purpureus]
MMESVRQLPNVVTSHIPDKTTQKPETLTHQPFLIRKCKDLSNTLELKPGDLAYEFGGTRSEGWNCLFLLLGSDGSCSTNEPPHHELVMMRFTTMQILH